MSNLLPCFYDYLDIAANSSELESEFDLHSSNQESVKSYNGLIKDSVEDSLRLIDYILNNPDIRNQINNRLSTDIIEIKED